MLKFAQWVEQQENLLPSEASKISYVAAVLDRPSQERLYNAISTILPIPDEWTKYCHHMTIAFQPKDTNNLPVLGHPVSIVVTEYAADMKGIAVKVEPNTNPTELKMSPNQLPHITIAVAPGVKPVYSNELLKRNSNKKVTDNLILQSYTAAIMKNGLTLPQRNDYALKSF